MAGERIRIRVVLEGLALIQQQEWDGDELYVLVTPTLGSSRGKTIRHPREKRYWKLKNSDKNIDPLIGPGVRPLQYTLFEGAFRSGDKLELAFWEEDFAPIDPDDPLTIVTLHFAEEQPGRLTARMTASRKIPEQQGSVWIRPPGNEPKDNAVGAARIIGKGCEYAAYLRFDPA